MKVSEITDDVLLKAIKHHIYNLLIEEDVEDSIAPYLKNECDIEVQFKDIKPLYERIIQWAKVKD